MTIADALHKSTVLLEQHFCPNSFPRQEAEELLAAASGRTRSALISDRTSSLDDDTYDSLLRFCERRCAHEPLAHIIGHAPFLTRSFLVTSDTLIPRPATELVVEQALHRLPKTYSGSIIDVGTGSGCIAISCAAARPYATTIAIDWSEEALEVARRNAAAHKVAARITFLRSNCLDGIEVNWDAGVLLIANLPYLPEGLWHELAPDITLFEPRLALTSGSDGMDAYRALAADLAELVPHTTPITVVWELLPEQAAAAAKLLTETLPWVAVENLRNHQDVIIGVMATTP
jgi:release factor glutamine methyltransferase